MSSYSICFIYTMFSYSVVLSYLFALLASGSKLLWKEIVPSFPKYLPLLSIFSCHTSIHVIILLFTYCTSCVSLFKYLLQLNTILYTRTYTLFIRITLFFVMYIYILLLFVTCLITFFSCMYQTFLHMSLCITNLAFISSIDVFQFSYCC